MPRHLRSSPQIDGSLVGVGAGLGLLWALVSIPVGLQWGVAPWSPLWEQALAFTLCFPLFVGLYGGGPLEWTIWPGFVFFVVRSVAFFLGIL
jgi:hypothetical protein